MSSKREEQPIRERAYFIWEPEGRPKGRNIANWLEAKAEFKQEYNDVGGFVRSWADVRAAGDHSQGGQRRGRHRGPSSRRNIQVEE